MLERFKKSVRFTIDITTWCIIAGLFHIGYSLYNIKSRLSYYEFV